MKKQLNKLKIRNICLVIGGIAIVVLGMHIYTKYFQPKKDIEEKEEVAYSENEDPVLKYYVENKDDLHLEEKFDISNYYIDNKFEAANYYYIDENQILWGYGSNEYGQLGNGKQYNSENGYTDYSESEPQKIAENIIHLDVGGTYFAIYLTNDGKLYGMGANLNGLMGMDTSKEFDYLLNPGKIVADKPALLMEDVSYARCGDRNIIALKNDGSVWWWGEFRTTSSKTENDVVSVSYPKPVKMLDEAVYVSSSSSCAGAIKRDGSLWVWGNNTFGSLGVESENRDFIEKPIEVLNNVKMVWFDSIEFNSILNSEISIYAGNPYDCAYPFVTFVEKTDGSLMACGLNVDGKKSKKETLSMYGDILRTGQTIGEEVLSPQEVTYSDVFCPFYMIEKDRTPNLKLKECQYGWSPKELGNYLNDIGMEYRVVEGTEDGKEVYYFVSENQYYHFYFDEEKKLYQFGICAYGSRDGKLKIGMKKNKVEEILGSPIDKSTSADNERSTSSVYLVDNVYFIISYYDNRIYAIKESISQIDI